MSAQHASIEVLFQEPPGRVWPLVSDTDLLNRLSGLPPVQYRHELGADGLPRRFGTLRQGGMRMGFEELPYTWEHGRFWRVERHLDAGPIASLVVRLSLTPEGSRGCRVRVSCEAQPRSRLVAPLVSLLLRWKMMRDFRRSLERWSQQLAVRVEPRALALMERRQPADAAARQRIAERMARLRELHPSPLVERLQEALVEQSPLTLHRMRPYGYAREWGAPRQEVVELFLAAVQVGLLVMRWDVICPHCRSDPENHASLSQVREQASCPACNVVFDVDLSRTLEVLFAPNPAVRASEPARHCGSGPGHMPHIVLQRVLAPGERREVKLALPPGRYRVRSHGTQGLRLLELCAEEAEAPRAAQFTFSAEGVRGEDLRLAGRGALGLELVNESARQVLAIVERVEWLQDALMASELLVSPRFSELFSSQALAPGVRLAIQRVVVLFTDLVGSTALYRQLGDARAFQYVWGHFAALREALEREGGLLVKTIGDAVMAVFLEPREALRGAAALHEAMVRHGERTGLPVGLRVGLASGPAYAVNLNERLDYFGSTVNLAARVQGSSQGGDILAPMELIQEAGGPEVLTSGGWESEPVSLSAKGFEHPIASLRFCRREAVRATG